MLTFCDTDGNGKNSKEEVYACCEYYSPLIYNSAKEMDQLGDDAPPSAEAATTLCK